MEKTIDNGNSENTEMTSNSENIKSNDSIHNDKSGNIINLDVSTWEVEEIPPKLQPVRNIDIDKIYSNNDYIDVFSNSSNVNVDQQLQPDNINKRPKRKKFRKIIIIFFVVLIIVLLGLGILYFLNEYGIIILI